MLPEKQGYEGRGKEESVEGVSGQAVPVKQSGNGPQSPSEAARLMGKCVLQTDFYGLLSTGWTRGDDVASKC